MDSEYKVLVDKLNSETKAYITKIDLYFAQMDGFINCALSKDVAIKFEGSIQLCAFLGVSDSEILHSSNEVDDFMLI